MKNKVKVRGYTNSKRFVSGSFSANVNKNQISITHKNDVSVTLYDPKTSYEALRDAFEDILRALPLLQNKHDKLHEEDTEDEIEA